MKSSLDDYLNPRDYQGALALLDFSNKKDKELWKAYCFFHNGDFEGARKVYENLIHSSTTTHGIRKDSLQCQDVCLYLACCDFHLKRYDDARTSIAEYRGESPLKSRLVLLLKKKGFTMDSHDIEQPNRVGGGSDEYVPSEMFKAAMLYADCNFQEAAETYKNILRLHPEFLALHVFVAMCYFKMNYLDVALETLAVYERSTAGADSVFTRNLKASISFRLHGYTLQQEDLKELNSINNFLPYSDILRHNTVIFNNIDKSLEILPVLLDIVPEARLNLATYHLIHFNVKEAYNLVKNLKPRSAHEYVVKGAVFASLGQIIGDNDLLSEALTLFAFVGDSPTEKDTIPGRQCMASCLFLKKQYSDALVYLSSVESYLTNDDEFNWNFGISLAAVEEYEKAEEVLLRIKNKSYIGDVNYNLWLAHCFLKNNKGLSAWRLLSNIKDSDRNSFLKVIADKSFQAGDYTTSLKAFQALYEMNRDSTTALGLKSSCIGVFYSALTKISTTKRLPTEEQKDIKEAIHILQKYDLDESGSVVVAMKDFTST